jgi:hypothetical protein
MAWLAARGFAEVCATEELGVETTAETSGGVGGFCIFAHLKERQGKMHDQQVFSARRIHLAARVALGKLTRAVGGCRAPCFPSNCGRPAQHICGKAVRSLVVESHMTEQPLKDAIAHRWYARPVFFVSNVQRAIGFYVGMLGFEKRWHEADGKGTVCQVDRGGCEIILCEDAARSDRGRLFISLTRAGLDQLIAETVERSVPTQNSWWGYDVIRIGDPDGNELLFPLANE